MKGFARLKSMNASEQKPGRGESPSANPPPLGDNHSMFQLLFERSADPIILFDPQLGVFVDCNQALVELMDADSKDQFLQRRPEDFSPPMQPNGLSSRDMTAEVVALVEKNGSHRFEWVGRRMDGREVPMEVLVTKIEVDGRSLNVSVVRDITERKKAERELRELNCSLERRVAERTAALATSEAQFRALVEHAPEAIVVFDGKTGRIHFGNEHASTLYGVPMEKLAELTPEAVSPEFQPNGRRSSELAREKMDEALAGGTPVFEWMHRRPDGTLIPTEVRLLRLPAEGQNLVRASIIDNTERKRAEQALRESEEKFRALFEGSSQGVILQDEHQFLEVNPAAVRIMGCKSPEELLGKHPMDTSPPFQPNGESTEVLARKYIQECLANGSARFEWMSRTPQGKDVPLEVTLTRIEWSGRQVIQALLNDIRERKEAEGELRASEARLRESEARFSAAFQASPVLITIGRVADRRFVLVNDAFVRWTGFSREEILGRTTVDLNMWEDPKEREALWAELHRAGSVDERECRFRDRSGKSFTMLLSSKIIQLNDVPHTLTMGVDITERKRAQAALAESEARFSVAFQASPIFIGIGRMSDGRFELVNDAFVNWTGYTRDEVVGRSTAELNLWDSPEERHAFWADTRQHGFVRTRECGFRNRYGKRFTILLSSEIIQLNGVPHMLSMGLDITERKQAEAELRNSEARLRESEARFSAAFHSSPFVTVMIRASDARVVLVNDAFVNWSGYDRDEIIGHTTVELGFWENLADRERFWKDVKASGSIRGRECRLIGRCGKVSTMLASGVIIESNGEEHLLVMVVDISQRKQAEAELHRMLAREKELSQLKSNFVSMVSHEFRTPLGIIQSSAELLRDFYQKMDAHEREEQLESIARNTRRMAGMMEEILVLSRLDAGKLDFQPADLDLNAFCRRLLAEVLSATNHRCPVELQLKPASAQARADERLIGHIFTNLLNNAVKYSAPGNTVHFTVERDGADAVCVVRDRGIGISEEDQQHLFKAFYRGGNVGTRPGTGLGLLLVKNCADLHGGKVWLDSKIGEGTTVTVRLPVYGRHNEKNIGN